MRARMPLRGSLSAHLASMLLLWHDGWPEVQYASFCSYVSKSNKLIKAVLDPVSEGLALATSQTDCACFLGICTATGCEACVPAAN
jgi:hypothetical protein